MTEFDLRKYLYSNPLLEKKEDSKKGNKEEQKRMKGAIKDDADHIEKLKKDLKADKKKLSKLKKDEPKDVNEVEGAVEEKMSNPVMRRGLKGDDKEEKRTEKMREGEEPKLTKEGLKDMIREKIASILNEEEIEEQEDVEVRDEENVDVDIEKDVEVDDVSKETDIDVKTSLPGESEDVDAVLGLLTKASEEAGRFADDEELKTQIGNVIPYFTRKHVAK